MKQFIKISLLFIYVFFNAGLSYSLHYCGEDLAVINLYAESKTCCPEEENMPDCCEDITHLEANNTIQHIADVIPFFFASIDLGYAYSELMELLQFHFTEPDRFYIFDHHESFIRQFVPIHIKNQTFLI